MAPSLIKGIDDIDSGTLVGRPLSRVTQYVSQSRPLRETGGGRFFDRSRMPAFHIIPGAGKGPESKKHETQPLSALQGGEGGARRGALGG